MGDGEGGGEVGEARGGRLRREDQFDGAFRIEREAVVAELAGDAGRVSPREERRAVRRQRDGPGAVRVLRLEGDVRIGERTRLVDVEHPLVVEAMGPSVDGSGKRQLEEAARALVGGAELRDVVRRKQRRGAGRERARDLLRVEDGAGKIARRDGDVRRQVARRVVQPPDLDLRRIAVRGRRDDGHVLEEAAGVVLEVLPLAAVFDGTPAGDGPVVVQLPEERAHAARAQAAPALDCGLDREGLLDLRDPEHRLRAFREAEVARHRLEHPPVPAGVLLVVLEERGGGVELVGSAEREGHFRGGEALVAELAAEARLVLVVVVEALVLVPDSPVVHVALVVVVPGVGVVAGAAAGRGGPERPGGVVLRDGVGLDLRAGLKRLEVVWTVLAARLEPGEGADAFVVAAPEGDGGVVA